MSDDDDSDDYYLLKTCFLALALQNACVQFSGIQASSQYEVNQYTFFSNFQVKMLKFDTISLPFWQLGQFRWQLAVLPMFPNACWSPIKFILHLHFNRS